MQTYGYALFFLTPEDLKYLKTSSGWSLGTGPNLVIADAGFGTDASTTTVRSGVYAFIFDQKGLMAGIGLVGQKISPDQVIFRAALAEGGRRNPFCCTNPKYSAADSPHLID